MPDDYFPMKQAQSVAEFMKCTVQEAMKLAKENGALYDTVWVFARAEAMAERIKGR